MKEIERKFLVKSDSYKNQAIRKYRIVQAFLNTDPQRTVRIRIQGNTGFLTVKGKADQKGITRFEWEREISVEDAGQLLVLCEPGKIEKIRYEIAAGSHLYEVDEFLNENEGLIIAEIELNSEDENFEKPDWLGEEVTGQLRYFNSSLSKNPYKNWES